jgi:DNA-binding response OmpR family regulator
MGDPTAATRILIVEDHAFFSDALRLVLHQQLTGGATFRHAPTVAEGRRLVHEEGPFDLAVVDLMLPDGDGTDVVRAVKGRWPETPVAVLSFARDLSVAREAGADETINKLESLESIIAKLERLASGGERPAT